ncbi:MAG: hypothetical protein PVJ43_04410 [Gemmatimonadales bacterium]
MAGDSALGDSPTMDDSDEDDGGGDKTLRRGAMEAAEGDGQRR